MRMNIDGVIGELDTLPGCTQIAISHSVFLNIKDRNKGKGTEANLKRIEVAKHLGYDYILCTVASTNERQIKILEKNKWKQLDSFFSEKTNHIVFLYGRML